MAREDIVVSPVPPGSAKLRAVKALWRRHSATLGFFPDGAFEEHARKGWILGATGQSGMLEAYLLYRLSGIAAVIVHLCVGEPFRGKGLARHLVESLRDATGDCSGIRANCRADFAANLMWPRLHFVPRHERPAREPGRYLKTWWYDYGKPDLFSLETRDVPIAVMDANVFFDLQYGTDSSAVESRGLLADWLEGIVRLALAPEIYNEIDRRLRSREREDAKRRAESFLLLRPPALEYSSWVERVEALLPPARSPSDESDLRQLAGSIAGGARFFLSRDGGLRGQANRIVEHTGIRVLRPSELIGLTDEELNSVSYQPVRLAGLRLTVCRAKAAETDHLAGKFLMNEFGEKKSTLLASMRAAAASPTKTRVMRVNDSNGDAVALLVVDTGEPGDVTRIVRLRVIGTPTDATLASHLIWHVVREAACRMSARVEVVDEYLSPHAKEALTRLHFARRGAEFVKVNAYGLLPIEDMLALLGEEAGAGAAAEVHRKDAPEARRRLQLVLETALWPCKTLNGELPTFIVPIKPQWAMQLFDEAASQEDLFGAEPALMLRTENIYYRAARPRFPDGPARVLWYVSSGRDVRRAQHLVGCSLVTGVWTGSAKGMYTRFRRLGAFGWPQVLRVAKGRPMNEVLGFTFSHTELFREPIRFSELRKLMSKYGLKQTTIQGPIRVPDELFASVYRERAV